MALTPLEILPEHPTIDIGDTLELLGERARPALEAALRSSDPALAGAARACLDRLDAPSTREMELVHGRRADGAGMGHLGGGGGGFRPPPPEEDSDEEML